MYIQKTYFFLDSNEYEFVYKGKYGAKGEKRAKRKKPTPEQMKKQNQTNKENKVRRLIKKNFTKRDYWITLKYKAGERPGVKKLKKDFQKFIRRLRRVYTKLSAELKYIYRMEIGRLGGVHTHMILNRVGSGLDVVVRDAWIASGGYAIDYELLRDEDGYSELAKYIVKEPDEEQAQQLSLFETEEAEQLVRYGRSRNLEEPVPEKKAYSRRTVRRLVEDGPKPSKGCYIDKNSIRCGVNPYTGLSYLRYTEIKKSEVRQN